MTTTQPTPVCPRDGAALAPLEVQGLALDSCPACGGLWFDLGELRRAEDREDPDLRWLEFTLWRDEHAFELTPTPMPCPRCALGPPPGATDVAGVADVTQITGATGTTGTNPAVPRLGSALYHDTGVLVHTCAACEGTWLDHGDLGYIVRHLEAELDALPTSSLVAASLGEAAQLVTRRGALAAEWGDLRGVLGLIARRFGTRHHGLLARLAQAMRETPLA
ncbi:MAG: zf-TFIIB domain-containing protein [Planctomycetota bacterium]